MKRRYLKQVALKLMMKKLREENVKDGFVNLLSVHTESALIRDAILEEMDPSEIPIEVDINSPDAEEEFKDEAIDDEEMGELIDKLPETEIDDATVAVGKMTDEDVPVDDDEFVGAPMESVMMMIEKYVPDCEEVSGNTDMIF
jgi:hypothetical protein